MTFDNYSKPEKSISHEKMVEWLKDVTNRVSEFQPDEIVAVARSGFSYAMWVAQMLKLPLGVFWPDRELLVIRPETTRVVFVDDNTVGGRTYEDVKKFMTENYPEIDFKFAVLFSDYQTPEHIIKEIITGQVVDYYITAPFPGTMKDCVPGVRFREQ